MGLGALDAALSGLRVSQQQLNVISNNVANVGTPGYTRKILPQSTQAINGTAVSVRAETIIRNVDTSLQRDVWTQVSRTSAINTTIEYLQTIEQFHGPPDAEVSFVAEVAELRDSFSRLSDSPEDGFLLSATVNQAVDTANKLNDFGRLLTQQRNDAQEELTQSVERVNDLLEQVAELNQQIRFQASTGRTTAQLEDFRDEAVRQLSEELEISYFTRGDGVLVVQTIQGQELAAETARELVFNPTPASPTTYYPDGGMSGLLLNGDPEEVPGGVDLTGLDIGGRMGALIELRDEILPQFTAQIDEFAHKLAVRFAAQGLTLFTDPSGRVPEDSVPVLDDPGTPFIDEGTPPTPVSYVGFATTIQVNEAVIANNNLLREGTYGDPGIESGSNEVIRRVLDFTFGDVAFQEARGVFDISDASILLAGTNNLQDYLGVYSRTALTGTSNLSAFVDRATLVADAGGQLDDPNDVFRINFSDLDLGYDVDVDVDLSNIASPGSGDFAQDLVNEINTQIGLAGVPALAQAVAEVGPSGQLVLRSRGDISISSDPAGAPPVLNGMSEAGLAFLGLTEAQSATAEDPYFEVQVGNDEPVRITLGPATTAADLLAQLQAVPNLGAEIDAAGNLVLRPGNSADPDFANFGGDIRITGGDFETDGTGLFTPPIDDDDGDAATPGLPSALPAGVNIVSALFGSFRDTDAAGGSITIQEFSPLSSVGYGSEVSSLDATTVPFRTNFLGPNSDISIEVTGSDTLLDFGQKIVNKQVEGIIIGQTRLEDEQSFQQLLERQLLDESGVNLDEELSNLIVVQTAYSAAARAISAVQEQFDELLNAFRR